MASSYPYQDRLFDAIMAGRNIILQAPTGAGKTRAALQPFLWMMTRFDEMADHSHFALPLTCRYAVPMRVLASQFCKEYDDYFARIDRSRGTRFIDRYASIGVTPPTIQTGETPEDPRFESPLTFCTIDQLLASFIGLPYSLGGGQANLNVGAVAGSYLILDEFHLYPLAENGWGARTTTLAMLRLLKGYSPFCLMTATFSSALLSQLAELLDAEIITVTPEELPEIMRGRTRSVAQFVTPLSADAILAAQTEGAAEGRGASLVVCNTVGRAQETYESIKQTLQDQGMLDAYNLMLLHSRFTDADRKAKSELLEQWMGKDQWRDGRFIGKETIVVGTQVVEVGLNISAGVLHSEIAPANSLIQRMGRCARFPMQQGRVIIYPIPPNDEGKASYLPYDAKLCQATDEYLATMILDGAATDFTFEREQELIDAVHTAEDQRMLDLFQKSRGQLERKIFEVLASHENGSQSELIRNVRQVNLIIHDDPDSAITKHPFNWQSFGLYPESLSGKWQALQERAATLGLDWTAKQLIVAGKADDEEDSSLAPVYTWDVLTKASQISGSLRIALPKQLATYDSELGFRLLLETADHTTDWQSKELPGKDPFKDDGTQQRSYVQHISGLMRAYDTIVRHDVSWIAARLEHNLGLPPGSVDYAVRLAIACHDIGKLSRGWQRWAHAWQELMVQHYGPGFATKPGNAWLAKTDSPPWKERLALSQNFRIHRPHHAGEGAKASLPYIQQVVVDLFDQAGLPLEEGSSALLLMRAITNAIARHHSPLTDGYEAAEWDDGARKAIAEACAACRLNDLGAGVQLHKIDVGKFDRVDELWLPDSDSENGVPATWLSFIIVRALRLCDQRAERV